MERPAEACPVGFEHAGWSGQLVACLAEEASTILLSDESPTGERPKELEDPGTVCPEDFAWVGWIQDAVTCAGG